MSERPTTNHAADPWGRVASALSGGDDDRPEADHRALAVPPGWEGVAAGVGRTPAADRDALQPAAERDSLQPAAAPTGWSGLASALRQAAPGPETEPAREAPASPRPRVSHDGAERVAPLASTGRPRPDLAAGARRVGVALRRPRVALVTAAVAVVVVAAVIAAVVLSGGGLPSNAAFSVNGKVTTSATLQSQVTVLDKLQGVQAPAATNAKAYDAFIRTAAKGLVVRDVIGEVAAKRGITVTQKSTRDYLDQLVSSQYNGDQTKFDQQLSQAGVTEPEVLDALNAQQVEDQLYGKVTHQVPISDAQVTAAFGANQKSLNSPEMRAVSHIVVASQSTAQAIVGQLQAGGSFATLAQQDSLDTSTRGSGGSLGTVSATQLSAPFGPAAFAAALNMPFGPVQEPGGSWDVGLVTSITPAMAYGNDAQTQSAIKNYLEAQQLRSQWIGYLRQQISRAHITYAARYRPANPGSPPQPALPSLVDFVTQAHSPNPSGAGAASSAPTP